MKKKIASFVGVGVIATTGYVGIGTLNDDKATEQPSEKIQIEERAARTEDTSEDNSLEVAVASDEANDEVSGYKDGSYTGDGSYTANDGKVEEDIDFRFGVQDGKITSLELVGEAGHPISKHHQEEFMEAMPKQVIGKNIQDLTVETVSGASDTTTGFRKALDEIKNQASQS